MQKTKRVTGAKMTLPGSKIEVPGPIADKTRQEALNIIEKHDIPEFFDSVLDPPVDPAKLTKEERKDYAGKSSGLTDGDVAVSTMSRLNATCGHSDKKRWVATARIHPVSYTHLTLPTKA